MDFVVKIAGRMPASWRDAIDGFRSRHPRCNALIKRFILIASGGDATIARGVGAGLRFNAANSAMSFLMGTHDPISQGALKMLLKPGMTFFDVGANVGFFSVIAARLVGPGGRVVAFEPLPSNARALAHNARLNGFRNVAVRQEALAATNGEAAFLLSAEPTWGKLSDAGKPPDQHDGETTVAVRRLDGVIERDRLPVPDVMKIDVEGAEVDLLAGAERTLRERRPVILMELHGTNREIAGKLAALNYIAAVLGAPDEVAVAHWNANIIAIPAERADLEPLVAQLRSPHAAALAA
ncbi:FkbM family methyltransferase [bacterium]|nr:FkbM family methyltransferase [bacterium]